MLKLFTYPVFPTVLISLKIGWAHALVIVVGIQTLLGGITFLKRRRSSKTRKKDKTEILSKQQIDVWKKKKKTQYKGLVSLLQCMGWCPDSELFVHFYPFGSVQMDNINRFNYCWFFSKTRSRFTSACFVCVCSKYFLTAVPSQPWLKAIRWYFTHF